MTDDYMVAENPLRRLYYKLYNDPMDYNAAKTQCESDGTRLAIPRSDAENDFLVQIAKGMDSTHYKDLWIGINDIEEEGNFVAIDGSNLEFTSWPKNGLPESNAENKDGVVITFCDNRPSCWYHKVLETKYRFVCMETTDFMPNYKINIPIEEKNLPYRKLNCELPNVSCPEKIADGYLMAENPWRRMHYKVSNETMNYHKAKTRCESDGTRLAIPTSSAENDFLASLAENEPMWIGINDIDDGNNFVTLGGSKLKFRNTSPEKSGFWNYKDSQHKLKFICLKTHIIASTRYQKPPNDYSIAENSWGRSYYKIYNEPMTFLDSQTQCVSDGANLAIPRSTVENDFITGLIPDTKIWIGLHDINTEGSFVTVDGSG